MHDVRLELLYMPSRKSRCPLMTPGAGKTQYSCKKYEMDSSSNEGWGCRQTPEPLDLAFS